MSSANRGDKRHPDDYYCTPEWVTDAILDELGPVTSMLEPAAGTGAIMRTVAKRRPHLVVPNDDPPHLQPLQGLELSTLRAGICKKHGLHVKQGDFLGDHGFYPGQFELILTNPPYSLAMEFLKESLYLAGSYGRVCMLLRLSWMATKKRSYFHRAYPSDVFVLSKRPSFTDDGATDSCDYAWFLWGPEVSRTWHVI